MQFKTELHCHTSEVSRCGRVTAAETVETWVFTFRFPTCTSTLPSLSGARRAVPRCPIASRYSGVPGLISAAEIATRAGRTASFVSSPETVSSFFVTCCRAFSSAAFLFSAAIASRIRASISAFASRSICRASRRASSKIFRRRFSVFSASFERRSFISRARSRSDRADSLSSAMARRCSSRRRITSSKRVFSAVIKSFAFSITGPGIPSRPAMANALLCPSAPISSR